MEASARILLRAFLFTMVLRGASHAAETVYHFVDERGVSHFSNVPHDPRYRAGWRVRPSAPDAGTAEPLLLSVSAPDTARRGEILDVSLALPGSTAVYGAIELLFDPDALTFDDATVEATLVAPGRLRLEVDPGIDSVFAADVRLRVRDDASGITVLETVVLDLESEDRTPRRATATTSNAIRLTLR